MHNAASSSPAVGWTRGINYTISQKVPNRIEPQQPTAVIFSRSHLLLAPPFLPPSSSPSFHLPNKPLRPNCLSQALLLEGPNSDAHTEAADSRVCSVTTGFYFASSIPDSKRDCYKLYDNLLTTCNLFIQDWWQCPQGKMVLDISEVSLLFAW